MNSQNLINNITEQILELQLKLGFENESITLYYPYDSVRFLLETDKTDSELPALVREILNAADMGSIEVKATKSRMSVTLSPEAVSYIHDHFTPSAFLKDIIALFSRHHGITLADILSVFDRYSPDYICEKMPEGSDFDYAIHFTDLSVDGFYYCIKDELGHMIYHRFIESDYNALMNS